MFKFTNYLAILLIFQFGSICVESLRVKFNFPSVYESVAYDRQEYTVSEDEPLEIACISPEGSPILNYPDLEPVTRWGERILSPTQVRTVVETFKDEYGNSRENVSITLRKERTKYGDAGNYECYLPTMEARSNIIIHVLTKRSFFVENNIVPVPMIDYDTENFIEFEASFKINCEATSPYHDLIIYRDDVVVMKHEAGKLYPLSSLEVMFEGLYRCELKDQERIVAQKKFKVISAKWRSTKPVIVGQEITHAIRDQTVRINCTMNDNIFIPTNLTWILPVENSSRYKIRDYEFFHPNLMNCRTIVKELEIINVNDNDVGEYKCRMDFFILDNTRIMQSTVTKLEVHAPDFTMIEISTTQAKYKKVVGDDIQLVVSINSYPYQPEILWFDPEGHPIMQRNNKFKIENTNVQTKLEIMNLKSSDSGSYEVLVKTPGSQDKMISFSLDVAENLFIHHFENVKPYYMKNDSARIDCVTSPGLNLTKQWMFKAHHDTFPPSTTMRTRDIEFMSENVTVEWRVQSSGNITCEACALKPNGSLECYMAKKQILMTDVPDGFGIIPSKENVIVNDSLELVCAASVFDFSDKIEWLNGDYSPILTSERVNITMMKTLLTYRSKLTINPVEESDNKEYICSSIMTKDNMKMRVMRKSYILKTETPKLPEIVTNLNVTESIVINQTEPIISSEI